MDTPQTAVVYVSADKAAFTLDEVAKLLALARWPEVEGRRISYPLRFTAPHKRGAVLTDADHAALAAIWKRAKLPPPAFPMPESEWHSYMQAFERSKAKPEWLLGCCVEDDACAHRMLRIAAEEEFKAKLAEAIRAGSIAARDPLTHMQCTDVRMTAMQRDLLVSRADFDQFAASAMFEVRTEPGKATALARAERIEARCQELKAQGVRGWLKQAAHEFGLSVTRIKQIRDWLRER